MTSNATVFSLRFNSIQVILILSFKNHDIVYFVGPHAGTIAPVTSTMKNHKLYKRRGRIAIGISEDIRCYPDDPNDNMYWVRFEDDHIPLRQVQGDWLIQEKEYTERFTGN